jgi:hypothetical protein
VVVVVVIVVPLLLAALWVHWRPCSVLRVALEVIALAVGLLLACFAAVWCCNHHLV